MEKYLLEKIERSIFYVFSSRNTSRLLTKEVFEGIPQVANADLVRAFEDLEKRLRLLVRYTADGHDWISLTPEGANLAGLKEQAHATPPNAVPHPPKSSTSPPHG